MKYRIEKECIKTFISYVYNYLKCVYNYMWKTHD